VPLATGGVRAEWLAGALSDAASEFSGFRPAFEDGLRAALLVVESTPGWTRDLKDVHSKLGTAISGLKRFTQDVSSLERLVAERPLQLGAVDPSGCVERAARLAARLLRAGRIRLKNDIPEPPPTVRADEDRLTEAFLLLLISSRDVLRKGKDASTDDSTISRRRTIHVELGSLPPWIQILVSNNGPAVLTHPVEEFRSLGRSTLNRAGLRGVAEAAEILRSLGGGLIYQPLGEKGNRFILTLKKG
jgi:signal transduction histidine kinase